MEILKLTQNLTDSSLFHYRIKLLTWHHVINESHHKGSCVHPCRPARSRGQHWRHNWSMQLKTAAPPFLGFALSTALRCSEWQNTTQLMLKGQCTYSTWTRKSKWWSMVKHLFAFFQFELPEHWIWLVSVHDPITCRAICWLLCHISCILCTH